MCRQLSRTLGAFLLALIALLAWAPAAGAHTSLVGSDPAHRSTLAEKPERIELRFSDPVDPRSVSLRIVDATGQTYSGATRRTPDRPDTTTVEFALPSSLPASALVGMQWESIGEDGHRASGEVVLTIGTAATPAPTPGAEPDAAPSATDGAAPVTGNTTPDSIAGSASDTSDRLLDVIAGFGRFSWYAGLALAIGGLIVLTWARASAHSDAPLATTGASVLEAGTQIAFLGTLLRWGSLVVILARGYSAGEGGIPSGDAVMDAVTSRNGTLGALALLTLAGGVASARRGALPVTWATLGIAALVEGAMGHAATDPDPGLATALAGAHLVAAACWIGPLAVLLVVAAQRRWSDDAVQPFLRTYANVAAWSFAVLVLTGVRALWVQSGGAIRGTTWGTLLIAKLFLVALVAVPLGLFHDRRVRSAVVPRRRTLAVEAGALVVILAVAAALSGLDPRPAVAGSSQPAEAAGTATATPAAATTDLSECADLEVGKPDCYRSYFTGIMKEQDAGAAIAEIARLSTTDDHVKADCHQIAHDLGHDAAQHYATLGEALAFEASVCWSGYYHGVIEFEMSGFDDAALLEQIPMVCNEAATERYSFTHYNCLHGVGHGVMLRFEADLFRSIPYCERLDDEWELSSCISGAFMENVVSAQQGHVPGTFKADDLLYPCTGVGIQYRDECYAMQTSYVLWKNGYDWEAAFELCDTVTDGFDDDCYQSMGRDISGAALLDVPTVVERCNLGREQLRSYCIVGASLNAVYNDHDTAKATELCEAVDQRYRVECLAARDRAAATF